MLERKLFVEIPKGKNDFHSAVLTCFSFNFHHFEYQVLRSLREKWISSINILVDNRMLDSLLGTASTNVDNLSQSYAVNGISSKGAFHPKINFFVGDNKVLVIFGSGNITPGGHGKNHELFTGFFVENLDDPQLSLTNETWNYLIKYSNELEGYTKKRINKTIAGTCGLINNEKINKHAYSRIDNEIDIALLYNDETSIFNQLTSLIPGNNIKGITVVCPYYDKDGKTLLNLLEAFPNAKMEVFLPLEFGLPPTEIEENDRIQFFNWEETKRGRIKVKGKGNVNYNRKLHSKIFHFESDEYEYCMIGSANATKYAFGTPAQPGINDEFAALYRTTEAGFLKSIGITGKKVKVSISDYHRDDNLVDNHTTEQRRRNTVTLSTIDLNQSNLKINIRSKYDLHDHVIGLYSLNGNQLIKYPIPESFDSGFSIRANDDLIRKNPRYAVILNQDGKFVSNKQIINYVHKLIHTNPSSSNRSIRELINTIEGGKINEYDIIDYINNIRNANSTSSSTSSSRKSDSKEKDDDENASNLTYEEAVERAKNRKDSSHIVNSHYSTRLWDSIAKLLKVRAKNIDEELKDEEEEGVAEESRPREVADIEKSDDEEKDFKRLKKKLSSVGEMAKNYIKSILGYSHESNHEITIIDLSKYLLTTHILTSIFRLSNYKLPKKVDARKWSEKLDKKYNDHMLEILILFSKMCIQSELKIYVEDSDLQLKMDDLTQKAIFHSFLYLNFIERTQIPEVIEDKLNLIGLNLLNNLSIPDESFEEYLRELSKAHHDTFFNPDRVIRLKNEIVELHNNGHLNEEYFILGHSGYCKLLEKGHGKVYYNSLYGKRAMKIKEYKKLIN